MKKKVKLDINPKAPLILTLPPPEHGRYVRVNRIEKGKVEVHNNFGYDAKIIDGALVFTPKKKSIFNRLFAFFFKYS